MRNSPNSKTKPGENNDKEDQEMIEESQKDFTPPQTTRSGRRRIVSNHTQDNEEEKEGAVVAKHEDEPNHKIEQNGVEAPKEVDAQQSSLVKIQVRPKINVSRFA